MFQPIRAHSFSQRWRDRYPLGRRATGLMLALIIEALLLLAMLTLGHVGPGRKEGGERLSAFNLAPPAEKESEEKSDRSEKPLQPQHPAEVRPTEQKPEPKVQPKPPLPSLIPMSVQDMAFADIAKLPPRPSSAKQPMGPADSGSAGDTPLMGTGPNGEPLYAAQWYRKPYDSELSGYLSTASGPGWGLIACKTEPEFRVDDCVIMDEYPAGSRIARAVLEAAWQFRVRPPRRGGRPLIGEWVGIRIDYEQRRQ